MIARAILVRQLIIDITEGTWKGGESCAELHLDPVLVPVQARPCKPFQGWRYLQPDAAPADVTAQGTAEGAAEGVAALPDKLRRELEFLGLL